MGTFFLRNIYLAKQGPRKDVGSGEPCCDSQHQLATSNFIAANTMMKKSPALREPSRLLYA